MELRNSLRFRLVVSFAAFAAVLTIFYGFAVWLAVVWSEDTTFERRLKSELDYYLTGPSSHPVRSEKLNRYISSYIGHANLPGEWRHLISHKEGIVELKESYDVYVLAKVLDSGRILYLVYDVSTLETLQKLEPFIFISIAISGVVVILIGIWIGKMMANRIIAPVSRLASVFQVTGKGTLPKNFAKDYYSDEVGFLANTLETQVQRISDFVEREIRFSRDASHELRTPVTSIKLALGLLVSAPEAKSVHLRKPLQRIQRAVSDMQHLLETLLWLSRESRGSSVSLDGSAEDLIEQNIENHRYLVGEKSVDVEFESQVEEMVTVPEQLFSIAVGNLIRNAFQFTERGFVKVILTQNLVRVCDSGIGISTDTLKGVDRVDSKLRGYGFGLEIVSRICNLCDWQLDISSVPQQGTDVTIYFDKASKSEPLKELTKSPATVSQFAGTQS